MVINDLVREISKRLTENAHFEACEIVMSVLGINRAQLIADSKRSVSESEINSALKMAYRRENGEPLQYILGECEFMSLPFYVESGVLIPRADTETLVETVINDAKPNMKILDICSGSGCIGISLASFIKGADVTMLDISDKAIEIANKNIARNNVTDRVMVKKLDILSECPKEKYDIIVSNPPYIETAVIDDLQTEVRDYEPHLALDGGEDGLLFYRRIVSIAPEILNGGGVLAFEIGYNEGAAVCALMEKNFDNIEIIKDLAGEDRVVRGDLRWKTK